MQHLPFLPQREIPYLGGPHYVDEGLEEFMKHRGWTMASLSRNDITDRSPRSRLAFLQALLHVALPIEILRIRGVRVTHQAFCPNGKVLDTSPLPGLIDSITMNPQDLSPALKEQHASRAYSVFRSALDCVPELLCRNTEDITLAIACMLITIAKLAVFLRIVPHENILKVDYATSTHLSPIELLFQSGWCPRKVAEVYSLTNISSLCYVTTLKRNPKVSYHEGCTLSRCITSQVESKTYQTSHTDSCDGCDHVAIDGVEIMKHISQGVVPRIQVGLVGGNLAEQQPKISITDNGPYAAISHVWAHGLGNPHQNSLPKCQLLRLHFLARESLQQTTPCEASGAFWIDTLCVPLESTARKQALALLRKTFHEAEFTVVLDHEIEQVLVDTLDHEIFWRLAMSDWARRLWTFEENLVPEDRVLLKCKDGLLNLAKRYQQVIDSSPLSAPRAEALYRYHPYDMLHVPQQTVLKSQCVDDTSIYFLDAAVRQASNLSTSRWEDEALCLASIMNQETASLAKLPPEDRIERFLSKIQMLPAHILFGNGPRSGKPGLGWAPASFLVDHDWPESTRIFEQHAGRYGTPPQFPNMKGFGVALGGYDLIKCAPWIRRDVLLKLPGLKAPIRYLRYRETLEDPRAWELEWWRGNCEVNSGPGFMPETFPSPLKLIALHEDLLGPTLLVQSLQVNAGVERVRFIAKIDVCLIDNPELSWEDTNLDWERGEVVHAVTIPREHRWFII